MSVESVINGIGTAIGVPGLGSSLKKISYDQLSGHDPQTFFNELMTIYAGKKPELSVVQLYIRARMEGKSASDALIAAMPASVMAGINAENSPGNNNPLPALVDTATKGIGDYLGEFITRLFGGTAEKIGTSAGTAAAQGIQTSVIPKWLWPLVGVIGLVLIFVLLFRKKLKL